MAARGLAPLVDPDVVDGQGGRERCQRVRPVAANRQVQDWVKVPMPVVIDDARCDGMITSGVFLLTRTDEVESCPTSLSVDSIVFFVTTSDLPPGLSSENNSADAPLPMRIEVMASPPTGASLVPLRN